jgi:uncharacterized surface protein with fasciclin (FAS1) repeats
VILPYPQRSGQTEKKLEIIYQTSQRRFQMHKVFIPLFMLLILVLTACGQADSPPEVLEATQAPTQTTEMIVEATPEPTQTPQVVLEPTPTEEPTVEPTTEPTPTVSNIPSEEDLTDKPYIADILQPDPDNSGGDAFKAFTDEDIRQFAVDVWASGIFIILLEPAPFTVFAPVYENEDIPQGTFTSFDQFREAVISHIVPGWYFEEDLIALDGQSLPTLAEGKTIDITVKDGIVYMNDVAMLIQSDIIARNGVIHVIDRFLLPPAE